MHICAVLEFFFNLKANKNHSAKFRLHANQGESHDLTPSCNFFTCLKRFGMAQNELQS